jgi:hypothetical protein
MDLGTCYRPIYLAKSSIEFHIYFPRCGKLLAMAFIFKGRGGTFKKMLVARPGGKPTK